MIAVGYLTTIEFWALFMYIYFVYILLFSQSPYYNTFLMFRYIFGPFAYIHAKSVKFTCSSRSSRASQSPYLVEKTTEIHARYAKPASPYNEAWIWTYPHGHSLLLYGLSTKFCEDSVESRTTLINVSNYVTAFLRCRYQRLGVIPKIWRQR